MTSILVTGAGGFIGRRVVRAAGDAGYGVTALVRRTTLNNVPGVIQHDLRLPLDNIPPADWIFHLAGGYAGASRQELERADLRMAHNIVCWGLQAGIRNWIFASAAEVYGDVPGQASEETPTQPVIPYGRIKLHVERLLMERFGKRPNQRVVILRIGEVYGSEGRLVSELTARLKRGFCPWPGSGHVPVSFVHVDDVVQAFLCAAQRAPAGISVYNLSDDMPATWHHFLREFAQLCRAKPPVFLPMPLIQTYAACSTLARRVTGRQPILTKHTVRLLVTPKALSNARVKQELGFRPCYPNYAKGLEEVLSGLSDHA